MVKMGLKRAASSLFLIFSALNSATGFAMAELDTASLQTLHCADEADRPQVIESETLNVVTLNIAHGRGLALNQMLVGAEQHRSNLFDIAAQLKQTEAQVFALQEADGPSLWSGQFDHIDLLSAAIGARCSIHGQHAVNWLHSFGTALLSNFQLHQMDSHAFKPSFPTTTKGFVRASVNWKTADQKNPTRVTLVSVHLDFSRRKVREQQIAEMVEQLSGLQRPLIIMGDFNADWSKEDSPVRKIASQFNLHGFTPTSKQYGTYKSSKRLDWILISDSLDFAEYKVLPDAVSDHLAVFAKITWAKPLTAQ